VTVLLYSLPVGTFPHVRWHLLTCHVVKKQAAEDDDDIIAGPQKMSLRDSVCTLMKHNPGSWTYIYNLQLTMVRVATPTRSTKCVHPSCFDATTWYTMMESTTTWQCPICDKVLDPDDLFVDGFVFDTIMSSTSTNLMQVFREHNRGDTRGL
jgi:E3 SUMO-protein ligase PIAS1